MGGASLSLRSSGPVEMSLQAASPDSIYFKLALRPKQWPGALLSPFMAELRKTFSDLPLSIASCVALGTTIPLPHRICDLETPSGSTSCVLTWQHVLENIC